MYGSGRWGLGQGEGGEGEGEGCGRTSQGESVGSADWTILSRLNILICLPALIPQLLPSLSRHADLRSADLYPADIRHLMWINSTRFYFILNLYD